MYRKCLDPKDVKVKISKEQVDYIYNKIKEASRKLKSGMYLDCYIGEGVQLPVMSYGPASLSDVNQLKEFIGGYYARTEVVAETKGKSPLPKESWPDKSWEEK